MSSQKYYNRLAIWTVLLIAIIFLSSFKSSLELNNIYPLKTGSYSEISDQTIIKSDSLARISYLIQRFVSAKDTSGLLSLSDSLKKALITHISDSSFLAELYYYIGVSDLLLNKYEEAVKWFKMSVEIKKKLGLTDNHYTNAIFNLGISFNLMGDHSQACNYWLLYIRESISIYGENSPEIAEAYSALIGISFELKDFNKFNEYTFKALGILSINSTALQGMKLSNLYGIIGSGYARMGDYAKGRIYLEKAESIIRDGYIIGEQNYINLINSMAITYSYLGMNEKATEYFDKGIELAISNNSFLAYNMINSYVFDLGNSGRVREGKDFLSRLVTKAGNVYGTESRYYYEVLKNYADYLSNYYPEDLPESLVLYSECLEYLGKHPEDKILRDQALIGYALALHKKGEYVRALEMVQELLFGKAEINSENDLYKNPDADSLKADERTLRVLQTKYMILWDIYSGTGAQNVIDVAAGTSELMISLIDKIRINISEEESRMVLGNHFRDSYIQAIRSFELCYRNSGEYRYLEKAFEFAEKSKVAGLLAATRELNAIQFHIPEEIADKEKSLLKEISIYNSRISRETEMGAPDKKLMTSLNENLLSAIRVRDSLVLTFEKDYPGYYSIKYSNIVPSLKEIPSITGRNNNYINYVMSDSMLYIFLVNRKYQEILTCKTDSSFVIKLRKFRLLLSNPSSLESSRAQFNDFQKTGFDLYRILIEPVKKYLISNSLIISPDNLLSYLPFETFLSSTYSGNEILYRKLNYLMNDFSISYIYSATFMQEAVSRSYKNSKNLVAFAPVYSRVINSDSLFMKRKSDGFLNSLPYSRQEAEYISKITNGKLYLENDARESTFKLEAGKYGIIHLAMHTYLNDQYPMNSAMIFAKESDSAEDGLLQTYEVYGIPLKARMVVLSSCNTGSGKLSSGEGILSLARGFLYSGSQSVIMSMWEIEDRSGTDIIKMFYSNLLKGKSKSNALKKARKDYLKQASQLRSHPYFWSALIIYGDNSPVYGRCNKLIIITIALLLVVTGLFYLLKRRNS